MIILPNETDLVRHIRESLNAVGKEERKLSEPDWFPRIASTIATNVSSIGLKCYARGKPPPCDGEEFLWDFSAFIYDDDKTVAKEELFIAQAAIVGEVEWDENGIDYDFEKLLCVDSLVCFMTIQKRTFKEATKALDRLERAVRKRQGYARLRGVNRPPAFLLSCWTWDQQPRFVHRDVSQQLGRPLSKPVRGRRVLSDAGDGRR
jgi:hypothetical protein